jgi:hypothetical protein
MAFHIFHQNMRVFGGGSAARNLAFTNAVASVSASIGVDRIAVAGYTEVMNARAARNAIAGISATLDSRLTRTNYYLCGRTALGGREYIVISIYTSPNLALMPTNFNPAANGRVLMVNTLNGLQWQCFDSNDLDILTMPQNGIADSRGLAYVVGTFTSGGAAQNMVVGFIHNMYNLGNRSGAFQSLAVMMARIRARYNLAGNVPIIFGGDFNVGPRHLSRNLQIYTIYQANGGGPVNTTSSNAYDFWVSNANIGNNNATVYPQTRNVPLKLSDHAGIGLQLPWWP